jgi:PleD family two-component response regulator
MPRRVLVVDDDRSFREACRLRLEFEGFQVEEASSWVNFTKAFYSTPEPPDLVLFDINLGPSLSGDKMVSALKKGREHLTTKKQTKMILMSSLHEDEVADRAQKCGADGYLLKDDMCQRAAEPFLRKLKSFLE